MTSGLVQRRRRSSNAPARFTLQAGLVVALAALLWFMADNMFANLRQQGIASGWEFLSEPAGFSIIQTLIPYTPQSSYGRAFLVGLCNTLLVSFIGILLATVLGFTLGLARLSSNWLVRQIAGIYVEVIRNVPLLLQLFFWYFAVLRALPNARESLSWAGSFYLNNRGLYLPRPEWAEGSTAFSVIISATVLIFLARFLYRRLRNNPQKSSGSFSVIVGLSALVLLLVSTFTMGAPMTLEEPRFNRFNFTGGLVLLPEFVALIVALSTYTAAFIGEIVRAGILAVPLGQKEAARALGLSQSRVLRLVVIPQAMRVIIPPLTNQYLNLTKNSSLAVAIAYPDLVSVFAGTTLNQTGQAVEIIALTLAVYLTISLVTSLAMRLYEIRLRGGRLHA
jgi:general L-amino acid transport system permease protein